MASILEIIVKKKQQGTGVKKSQKEVDDLGKSVKNLQVAMVAGAAGAVAVGVALKKAFDLGREGAVVAQTAESFDFLLEKVGVAPDLLDDLRTAARGTVDDMTLMSSTMTLVAGAGDELGSALLQSTPQLLEIAKAANKLNPALGDTAFFYESIATGVKRAQPLILDNLGLTIKVGDANQAFADKLGKSVEALTAEEKQMAILEDVFRAGDEIIQQVGGSTDAATDSFDRLTVSLKNSADEAKKSLFVGLEPLIEGLALSVETSNAFTKAQKAGLITQEERTDLIIDSTTALELNEAALALITERTERLSVSTERVTAMQEGFARGLGDTTPIAAELGEVLDDVADTDISPLQQQFDDARAKIDLARSASQNFWDSIDTGILGSISRLQESIAFMLAGGTQVQSAFNEVESALRAGLIAPEEAESILREVEAAALAVAEQTGEISMEDATNQMRDKYNLSWKEAKALIENSVAIIDAIPFITEKRIEFFIEYTGAPFPSNIGPGGAHGLDMIVPPGFPNDTFPIRATSGERVTITPQGGGNLSVGDINVNVPAGTDGGGIVDEIMDELGRRVRQASSSGAGFVGS